MRRISGVLLYFVVIFASLGNIFCVHRNTQDVKNGPSSSHVHPTSHGSSIDHHGTSGHSHQPGTFSRQQLSDSGAFNSFSGRTGSQVISRVKLPGEDGNNSPYPVIHRQPSALPDSIRGASVINLAPEPVAEPPVTFLNRERLQRRNRIRNDGSGLNRVPVDVQPSSFEQTGAPLGGQGISPFSGQPTHGTSPPPFYDTRLSSFNGFSDGGGPFMTSRGLGVSGYPGPPGSPMMSGQQNYGEILRTIDAMLDSIPPHLRRMLIRTRRMRRRNRIQQLLQMASQQLGLPPVRGI